MEITAAQKANLLACIRVAASILQVDASDDSLAKHATLVQLRRDVEAATVAESALLDLVQV